MFAFVATILLGVFTLASCSSDDDVDPYKVRHTYSPAVEIITSKSEWKQAAMVESENLTRDILSQLKYKQVVLNRTEASMFWMEQINANDELSKAMQTAADEYGKQADDTSLKCVFKLIEDGKEEFQSKEWLTRYWLSL